jgi:AcrR family transcriptional regulator
MAIEKLTPEKRRERTRNALLDAAVDVFVRRGFNAASLDEIAETAGFTRGAIYKHFDSKADLFFAANERLNKETLGEFTRRFQDIPTTPEAVHEIAAAWREVMTSTTDFRIIGMEFQLYALRNPEVRERSRQHRQYTKKLVADFMAARAAEVGFTLAVPAETLAQIFLTTSDAFAEAALFDPDEARTYETFLTMMMQAMFKAPE